MKNLENTSSLAAKIRESGIGELLPNCDGIHFFDMPPHGGEENVGAWFCGDDEYEQAVCGIMIMQKNDDGWQIAFTAREGELGAEFIALSEVTEGGEMCFVRLGCEEKSVFILKNDESGFSLTDSTTDRKVRNDK